MGSLNFNIFQKFKYQSICNKKKLNSKPIVYKELSIGRLTSILKAKFTKCLPLGHSNWTIIRSDFNCVEECPSGGPCEVGCGQPGTPKLGALCCSGHRGQHAACTDDVADAINIRHESDQFRCIKPIQQGNTLQDSFYCPPVEKKYTTTLLKSFKFDDSV